VSERPARPASGAPPLPDGRGSVLFAVARLVCNHPDGRAVRARWPSGVPAPGSVIRPARAPNRTGPGPWGRPAR